MWIDCLARARVRTHVRTVYCTLLSYTLHMKPQFNGSLFVSEKVSLNSEPTMKHEKCVLFLSLMCRVSGKNEQNIEDWAIFLQDDCVTGCLAWGCRGWPFC